MQKTSTRYKPVRHSDPYPQTHLDAKKRKKTRYLFNDNISENKLLQTEQSCCQLIPHQLNIYHVACQRF